MSRAGRYRHRVTIQRVTETKDADGGYVKTWADLATVWAEIRGVGGREYFDKDVVTSEVSCVFIIRFRSDLVPTDRLSWNGDSYEIVAIGDRSGLRIENDIAAKLVT